MTRTILITGGSSGIGSAMVREFASRGYHVWFTYHTGRERSEQLIKEFGNETIQAFHLEQGNRASHRRLLEQLPGPVDILINNAGLGSKTVEQVSLDVHEQDREIMMVNSVGPVWLIRDIMPTMQSRGYGKIILVSSVGGGVAEFAGFHWSDCMSNAALAYLGKHIQAECAREPIDVFTICPGAVETPMFEMSTLAHLGNDERSRFLRSLPDGRLIDPSEIAKLAVWLCTDEARILRGAVLDSSLGLGVRPGLITESRR